MRIWDTGSWKVVETHSAHSRPVTHLQPIATSEWLPRAAQRAGRLELRRRTMAACEPGGLDGGSGVRAGDSGFGQQQQMRFASAADGSILLWKATILGNIVKFETPATRLWPADGEQDTTPVKSLRFSRAAGQLVAVLAKGVALCWDQLGLLAAGASAAAPPWAAMAEDLVLEGVEGVEDGACGPHAAVPHALSGACRAQSQMISPPHLRARRLC